jgi:hypothetical protein
VYHFGWGGMRNQLTSHRVESDSVPLAQVPHLQRSRRPQYRILPNSPVPQLAPKYSKSKVDSTLPNRSLSQQTHSSKMLCGPEIGKSKQTFHSGLRVLLTAWVTDRASPSTTTKNLKRCQKGVNSSKQDILGHSCHSCPLLLDFLPVSSLASAPPPHLEIEAILP